MDRKIKVVRIKEMISKLLIVVILGLISSKSFGSSIVSDELSEKTSLRRRAFTDPGKRFQRDESEKRTLEDFSLTTLSSICLNNIINQDYEHDKSATHPVIIEGYEYSLKVPIQTFQTIKARLASSTPDDEARTVIGESAFRYKKIEISPRATAKIQPGAEYKCGTEGHLYNFHLYRGETLIRNDPVVISIRKIDTGEEENKPHSPPVKESTSQDQISEKASSSKEALKKENKEKGATKKVDKSPASLPSKKGEPNLKKNPGPVRKEEELKNKRSPAIKQAKLSSSPVKKVLDAGPPLKKAKPPMKKEQPLKQGTGNSGKA